MDHGGHHVTPVEERRTLLLAVNLIDDHLPGSSLIEKLHHRLRAQCCGGGRREAAVNTSAVGSCWGEMSVTDLICAWRGPASHTAATPRGAAG